MIHPMSDDFDLDTPAGMAAAVEWTTNLVSLIRQGGVWIVPRSGTVYTFDHRTKSVTRTTSLYDGDAAVERVFRKMGWTVRVP